MKRSERPGAPRGPRRRRPLHQDAGLPRAHAGNRHAASADLGSRFDLSILPAPGSSPVAARIRWCRRGDVLRDIEALVDLDGWKMKRADVVTVAVAGDFARKAAACDRADGPPQPDARVRRGLPRDLRVGRCAAAPPHGGALPQQRAPAALADHGRQDCQRFRREKIGSRVGVVDDETMLSLSSPRVRDGAGVIADSLAHFSSSFRSFHALPASIPNRSRPGTIAPSIVA